MRSLGSGPLAALLDSPVLDAHGRLLGHVGAIGTRHGELRSIGIERASPESGTLRFASRECFTVEGDRIVLKA